MIRASTFRISATMTLATALLCTGCKGVPARPEGQALRPSEVMNFPELYNQNCAACHGVDGKNGAAISLANPVYLSLAGLNTIEQITADGVPGSLMPAFAREKGGMLTDQQIAVIAQGMETAWGHHDALSGSTAPMYATSAKGDVQQGQQAFQIFCARCHGADGSGVQRNKTNGGSIVDSSYLALISDQGLRSLIIAGQPEQGMPNWRSDGTGANARAMTDQEITNIVAWLVSHRVTSPGQPYAMPID